MNFISRLKEYCSLNIYLGSRYIDYIGLSISYIVCIIYLYNILDVKHRVIVDPARLQPTAVYKYVSIFQKTKPRQINCTQWNFPVLDVWHQNEKKCKTKVKRLRSSTKYFQKQIAWRTRCQCIDTVSDHVFEEKERRFQVEIMCQCTDTSWEKG